MAPPTVILKRRHSLLGKNMLPLVRKLRDFNGDRPIATFARLRSTLATESIPGSELAKHFRDLTGENEKEILEMAGREVTDENLMILLHLSIIYANDIGAPDGQELQQVGLICL